MLFGVYGCAVTRLVGFVPRLRDRASRATQGGQHVLIVGLRPCRLFLERCTACVCVCVGQTCSCQRFSSERRP